MVINVYLFLKNILDINVVKSTRKRMRVVTKLT